MAKVFIEETTLTNIGNAIRSKEGTTALILVTDMANRIEAISGGGGGGYEPTDADLTLTGEGQYKFSYNNFNWLINHYGKRITTNFSSGINYLFFSSDKLEEIPFDISLQSINGSSYVNSIFYNCNKLKSIPKINVATKYTTSAQYTYLDCDTIFYRCYCIREIPEDFYEQFVVDNYADIMKNVKCSPMKISYKDTFSLRSVSPRHFKFNKNYRGGTSYCRYNSMFTGCCSLDEIRDLYVDDVSTGTVYNGSAIFNNMIDRCFRLKTFTFELNPETNAPYEVNWSGQTINLSNQVGYYNYSSSESNITNYNSGITKDKKISSNDTYQALKNDPDAYVHGYEWSRYNHDSAVETINSLPDTSAYLTTTGGTNNITFKGAAGSNTDGGAINTLTEEEIAVAAAKGWTVTFA